MKSKQIVVYSIRVHGDMEMTIAVGLDVITGGIGIPWGYIPQSIPSVIIAANDSVTRPNPTKPTLEKH